MPGGFWTVDEQERLLRANGGAISFELMDELKRVYLDRMTVALSSYQDPSTGMPRHVPMAVDADGGGPADRDDEDRVVCWCTDQYCCLSTSLRHQEMLTMRWSADHLEAIGQLELARSIREDAETLAAEYGV